MIIVLQVAAVVGFAMRVDSRTSFHDEQLVQMRMQVGTLASDGRHGERGHYQHRKAGIYKPRRVADGAACGHDRQGARFGLRAIC